MEQILHNLLVLGKKIRGVFDILTARAVILAIKTKKHSGVRIIGYPPDIADLHRTLNESFTEAMSQNDDQLKALIEDTGLVKDFDAFVEAMNSGDEKEADKIAKRSSDKLEKFFKNG